MKDFIRHAYASPQTTLSGLALAIAINVYDVMNNQPNFGWRTVLVAALGAVVAYFGAVSRDAGKSDEDHGVDTVAKILTETK